MIHGWVSHSDRDSSGEDSTRQGKPYSAPSILDSLGWLGSWFEYR